MQIEFEYNLEKEIIGHLKRWVTPIEERKGPNTLFIADCMPARGQGVWDDGRSFISWSMLPREFVDYLKKQGVPIKVYSA